MGRQKSEAGKAKKAAEAKAARKAKAKAKAGQRAARSTTATIRESLASAIALHQRGQLEQAETVYLAVLGADEKNPDALHYLGVMRHQQGRSLLAIDLVLHAIEIKRTTDTKAFHALRWIRCQKGGVKSWGFPVA